MMGQNDEPWNCWGFKLFETQAMILIIPRAHSNSALPTFCQRAHGTPGTPEDVERLENRNGQN